MSQELSKATREMKHITLNQSLDGLFLAVQRVSNLRDRIRGEGPKPDKNKDVTEHPAPSLLNVLDSSSEYAHKMTAELDQIRSEIEEMLF